MDNVSSSYQVIFQGVAEGYDPDKAKQNLATHFKVAPEKLDALLKKNSAVIKTTQDYETALKYQAVLTKAGVLCSISGVKQAEKQTVAHQKVVKSTPKEEAKPVEEAKPAEEAKPTEEAKPARDLKNQSISAKHLGVVIFSLAIYIAALYFPCRDCSLSGLLIYLLPIIVMVLVWAFTNKSMVAMKALFSVAVLIFIFSYLWNKSTVNYHEVTVNYYEVKAQVIDALHLLAAAKVSNLLEHAHSDKFFTLEQLGIVTSNRSARMVLLDTDPVTLQVTMKTTKEGVSSLVANKTILYIYGLHQKRQEYQWQCLTKGSDAVPADFLPKTCINENQ